MSQVLLYPCCARDIGESLRTWFWNVISAMKDDAKLTAKKLASGSGAFRHISHRAIDSKTDQNGNSEMMACAYLQRDTHTQVEIKK